MNNGTSSKNVVTVLYKAGDQVNCETLKKGAGGSLQKPIEMLTYLLPRLKREGA